MGASYHSAEPERHDPFEGPRLWAVDNRDLLDLIWAKFVADEDWPNAKLLHRELFAEDKHFDANEFAMAIPPSLGRLDPTSGKIVLTPRGLSFVEQARPVLDSMASLVSIAVQRYRTPGDPVIGSSEFEGLLDIDARRARQLAEVVSQDSWLFRAAGGSINEGLRFQIDETAILRVRDVETIEGYLDAQAKAWYPDPPRRAGIQIANQPEPPRSQSADGVMVPEPLNGLHPVVLSASTRAWVTKHRREAIDRASVALVQAVRKLSGLHDLDGFALMAKAFNPNAPLIVVADLRDPVGRDLQKGTHHLAMGAMAGIRNAASHSLKDPSEVDARDQLAVLSLIFRRLDDARGAPPEWSGSGTEVPGTARHNP